MKDTSDPDWWIGHVDGYTGYFPHRYVLPLAAGQRVYQIVKPLHLSHGNNDIKLLRDQVCDTFLNSSYLVRQGWGIKNVIKMYAKN